MIYDHVLENISNIPTDIHVTVKLTAFYLMFYGSMNSL